MDATIVKRILQQCWSRETSTLWSEENPVRGQCDVTALVIHTHFGGRLLKTFINGQPHFYNQITGVRYDFTTSQFAVLPEYADLPTDREEILTSGSFVPQQYRTLLGQFETLLGQQNHVVHEASAGNT